MPDEKEPTSTRGEKPQVGAEAAAPAAAPASEPEAEPETGADGAAFLTVGIGASAGGLEALGDLLSNLQVDSMAVIVVQHLAPDHESALPHLLARTCHLPVVTAADGVTVEPGHVYVIPPNADLGVMRGVIRLLVPPRPQAPRLPIDFTFRSLADDQGSSAVGVVLSGTGTDGTFGLKAIKAAGGITFVQEPSTARYDGMPRSALASGAADFCLSPAEIAGELVRIARQPRVLRKAPAPAPSRYAQDQLGKLFVLIRSEFGNDLMQYKPSTIDRRIERRMTLHRIGRLEDYVRFVQSNLGELQALYKDMLITVTSFFRDPEAFEEIKKQVFPRLFQDRNLSRPVRAWVVACATGEEAYSIAMCLLEYCEEHALDTKIQIFATDIDEEAIQHARRGIYAENIAADVSPERLNRFFVRKGNEYQISRTVRDMVVFSAHNVLKNAPFSRMDLVSCRNLLIYLRSAAQKRVLRVLHYALNPGGHLFLGSSETVGDAPELFAAVDRASKIYVKQAVAAPGALDLGFGLAALPVEPAAPALPARPSLNLQGLADRKVLEHYGPPGVVIGDDLTILQFRGHTGPFLDPAAGAVSWNLLRLVRIELHIELKRAIEQARAQRQRVTTEVTVPEGEAPVVVRLDVMPLEEPDSGARCFLVLFHRLPPPREVPILPSPEAMTGEAMLPLAERIQDLERELAVTKEYLQSTIEERESTLEELKAANEELQSSNEELQSTNEELETSKEEMQSANEELTTVNEELQTRMAELSMTNDDLHNVLAGVDNPVVIVGMDLRIRRYTAAAETLFHLIPLDTGRPVGILGTFLGLPELEARVSAVIQHLSTSEEEIRATNDRWYALRISPYRTLDHTIRGALITVIDIDVRKRAQELTRDVGAYAAHFLAAINHPLLILDRKLRVVWCNEPFLVVFHLTVEETVGALLGNVGARRLGDPRLLQHVQDVLDSGATVRNLEMQVPFPEIGDRPVCIGCSRIPAAGETDLALLSIEPLGGRAS